MVALSGLSDEISANLRRQIEARGLPDLFGVRGFRPIMANIWAPGPYDILFGILFDILFDILFGILFDILFDILFGILF